MAEVSAQNQRRAVQGYIIGTYVQPLPDATIEVGHMAHEAWMFPLDYPPTAYVPPSDHPSPYRPVLRVRRR